MNFNRMSVKEEVIGYSQAILVLYGGGAAIGILWAFIQMALRAVY